MFDVRRSFVRCLLCAVAVALAAAPVRAADDAAAVAARRRRHLLIRDLADKKPSVRAEAERKLVRLGRSAVPDLILALRGHHVVVTSMTADEVEVAAARAARALGDIGDPRAVEPLLEALDYKSRLVRRSAATALGRLRAKQAVPKLTALIPGHDAAVAADAALALGNIGGPAAVKALRAALAAPEALKKAYKVEADVTRVRAAAAFALGALGDTTAVPALLTALRDSAARVRRHADLALRRMSKHSVGFQAGASEPEREKAAKAWDVFWKMRVGK